MAKLDAADARGKDYVIWDDELPGFGLRVFAPGKCSYLIQCRSAGRSRRYTIGQHGVWTPELVPDMPRPAAARRDREHGETEGDQHHSHQSESKGVHGNSPQYAVKFVGSALTVS